MVRIRAFQARGPGSIPGRRIYIYFLLRVKNLWAYGVMASTLDSESSNPGSNPGRPIFFFFLRTTIKLLWRNG